MADTKISALTALTTPASGDLIPIVDISDTTMAASGTTKSVTQADLAASFSPNWAAPGTIGSTTPNTGAFTSLSSTIGANFATSSGNVGIGTAGPGDSLTVSKSQNTETIIGVTNGNTGVSANAGFRMRNNGAGTSALLFMGTNASLGGLLRADGTYLYGGGAGGFTINTEVAQPIYFGINSAEKMRIDTSGNVGIGTASPSYQLHVNTDSAGKPGTGGLWTVVSDERIKTDIVPADLSRCYDIVKQVGLKHFGFKPGVYSDEQINDKHSLGWIAQDVQKVFGKAVSIKPFTLQTDIPDGTEEYEEQEFTVETVNKVETSIQVINGKPVQASKTTQVEEKTLLFDEVVVVDVAGDIVMVDGAPLTHKVPRMVTKTRPKVRREVIEDCLDLNGGQMNAALYGAVQCLMAKVEAQAVTIASLQASVAEQAHS